MSDRSGILKALVQGFKDYISTEYPVDPPVHINNIVGRELFFDDINDYPTVTMHNGPEVRKYSPARQVEGYLDVYCRMFVNNEEDSEGELTVLLDILEKYLDETHYIQYDVETNQGTVTKKTIDVMVEAISTAEGLLRPYGAAEISLTVHYEKSNHYQLA